MSEECINPNKPAVDNESLACEDLTSTDCTISEEADTFLKYAKGATLTSILGLISRCLQKLTTAQTNFLPTYQSYVVVLDQDGTSAPTEATVVANKANLSPTLAYVDVGEYTLTSVGSFDATKVQIIPPNNRPVYAAGVETQLDKFYVERVDDDTLSIKTARKSGGSTTLTNGLLDGVNTILEIRIYS